MFAPRFARNGLRMKSLTRVSETFNVKLPKARIKLIWLTLLAHYIVGVPITYGPPNHNIQVNHKFSTNYMWIQELHLYTSNEHVGVWREAINFRDYLVLLMFVFTITKIHAGDKIMLIFLPCFVQLCETLPLPLHLMLQYEALHVVNMCNKCKP